MWEIKYFKSYEEAKKFMLRVTKKAFRYELLFVNNGFAVEFKQIKKLNF